METEEVKELLSKEALEKNVLNRIMWDPIFDPSEFSISYFDRVTEQLIEIPCYNLNLEDDFLTTSEGMVPIHRIRKILYRGEVVWEKRRPLE